MAELGTFQRPFDQLSATDILALVEGGVEESRTLDFKRELPDNSERDKQKLRSHVCAFANSAGGDLIYGVDETAGKACSLVGLDAADADAAIQRLQQMLLSGIAPRVDVQIRAVPLGGGRIAIIVRVPRSWLGPHLVQFNDSFRMYRRHTKGNYSLDAEQIRDAFVSADEVPRRIRNWRDGRIARILDSETPVPLPGGTKLVIHLVPIGALGGAPPLSAVDLVRQSHGFPPPGLNWRGSRINLDGFVSFGGASAEQADALCYCQVFRSGQVEAVSAFEVAQDQAGNRWIAISAYEKWLLHRTRDYLDTLGELGVGYPIVVFFSMLDAKGTRLEIGSRHYRNPPKEIDRDIVLLPEVVLEEAVSRLDPHLRPMLDAAANAFGIPESPHFDREGNWTG